MPSLQNSILRLGFALLTLGSSGTCALAQNSSLLQRPAGMMASRAASVGNIAMGTSGVPAAENMPNTAAPQQTQLTAASWTFNPPPTQRVLKIHDVVSIRVDELARTTAEGRASQRKNVTYDAVLKNWVMLEGLKAVRKAPQTAGDPEVTGQMSDIYRANSDVLTRESLAFNNAATIVDIRPNGNIVLEAHKTININDNRWELSLSGICQSKDITPDNLVLSKDITDLIIDKHEAGQARDGYRRGWFTEWFSRLQPF